MDNPDLPTIVQPTRELDWQRVLVHMQQANAEQVSGLTLSLAIANATIDQVNQANAELGNVCAELVGECNMLRAKLQELTPETPEPESAPEVPESPLPAIL